MRNNEIINWKYLLNDVASKIYLLLLFQTLSMKELAIIIYGNKNEKRMISKYLKIFGPKGMRYILPAESKKFGTNEKYYKASLVPLFEFWTDTFQRNKNRLEKIMRRKSFRQMIRTFDVEAWNALKKEPESKELSNNIEMLNKINPLTDYEEGKLENVWNENINILRERFVKEILPYIRMPLIDWNVLILLTFFWLDLLNGVVYFRKAKKVKNDLEDNKLYFTKKEVLDERKKKTLLKNAHVMLDSMSDLEKSAVELTIGISESRLEEIRDFLGIILKHEQNMNLFSRKLYGKEENEH